MFSITRCTAFQNIDLPGTQLTAPPFLISSSDPPQPSQLQHQTTNRTDTTDSTNLQNLITRRSPSTGNPSILFLFGSASHGSLQMLKNGFFDHPPTISYCWSFRRTILALHVWLGPSLPLFGLPSPGLHLAFD